VSSFQLYSPPPPTRAHVPVLRDELLLRYPPKLKEVPFYCSFPPLSGISSDSLRLGIEVSPRALFSDVLARVS